MFLDDAGVRFGSPSIDGGCRRLCFFFRNGDS
jgi:hypothetical protein